MLFAHLKRILQLGRLRLRGPNGARDEFQARSHSPEPQKAGQAKVASNGDRLIRTKQSDSMT
jgi:hypothetical protein